MPSTLAMIRHLFDDPDERRKAIATWNAVLAGGVALGPIISGVLLEHFWWGSVFLINIPVMALLLVVAPALLPGHTAVPGRRVDLVSALLALAAILPVVDAIKSVAAQGWSASRLITLGVGVAVGAVFVWRQRRLADPLVDVVLLGERRFATSMTVNLVCMFAMLGNSILMTQYLQSVLGYSPLRAALWSLAPTVVVGATAPLAAVVANRIGRPAVIVTGLLVGASGFVVLAAMTGTDTLLPVLAGATLLAAGVVAATSMIADYVVGVAPAERAGATSGLLETTSELGGALGIAVLGSIVNVVFRMDITSRFGDGGPGTLAGALATAQRLPIERADALVDAARSAFVDGLSAAAWAGAAVLTFTAMVALWGLRSSRDRVPENDDDLAVGGDRSRAAEFQ